MFYHVKVTAPGGPYVYDDVTSVSCEDGYVIVTRADDVKSQHYFHDSELELVEIAGEGVFWTWTKSTRK
jgi:hypothetical protein